MSRGRGTVSCAIQSCLPTSSYLPFLLPCSSSSSSSPAAFLPSLDSARCGPAVAASNPAVIGTGTASTGSSTTLALATCVKQATPDLPLSVLDSSRSSSVRTDDACATLYQRAPLSPLNGRATPPPPPPPPPVPRRGWLPMVEGGTSTAQLDCQQRPWQSWLRLSPLPLAPRPLFTMEGF